MVLLIDNYDSFTYNLYDYILQLNRQCTVVRNDELSIEEIEKLKFENIVISPGPCRPESSGITNEIIAKYHLSKPILGVCLGHQALGEFFGAKLEKAIKPLHGKTSNINLTAHPLFKGLENSTEVMRYHSLVLQDVKAPLKVIATTNKNEVMAVVHESLPLAGIQFHPESILTKDGLKILANWFEWIDYFQNS